MSHAQCDMRPIPLHEVYLLYRSFSSVENDTGVLRTKDDFKRIFDEISSTLGAEYAENLHCHFSKIMYTEMGEKKHLTFEDDIYGPEFLPLAEAIVELGVSPTIICESAGTQSDDALMMKSIYESVLRG